MNLEFRYMGGGKWVANIRPQNNLPYMVFSIEASGLKEENDGMIHREYTVEAYLMYPEYGDPRSGLQSTSICSGTLNDAILMASELRAKIEADPENLVEPPKKKRSRKKFEASMEKEE